MLCRKTVDLFTLLSRTQDATNQRKVGMTQELLSLVTGLAHYLKILIRIASAAAGVARVRSRNRLVIAHAATEIDRRNLLSRF